MSAPKKRGPGRPSLGAAARGRVLSFRVTDEQAAQIESAAAGDDTTANEWARRRVLEAIGMEVSDGS